MELKVKKKEGPAYLADLDQLRRFAEKPTKDRVVLGGQLFLCSRAPLQNLDGFVLQAPRSTRRRAPWAKEKSDVLNLALDKEALSLVMKARIKPVFVIDGMLRYGQKLKGDHNIVLSAMETSISTQVTLLYFKKGVLETYDEYVLSAPSSHTYEADIHLLLERIRLAHMEAMFHWCGPLSMPRGQNLVVAPDTVWLNAPQQILTASGRATPLRRHGLSVLVLALAAAGYGLSIYPAYEKYHEAASRVERENAQLKGEYAFASDRLKELQAKKGFFGKSTDELAILEQHEQLMLTVAQQEGLTVKEATLTWPKLNPESELEHLARFEFLVEVQKHDTASALEQSNVLLRGLSDKTGLTLKLAAINGHTDLPASTPDSKGLRQYRIQGIFKNAS